MMHIKNNKNSNNNIINNNIINKSDNIDKQCQ